MAIFATLTASAQTDSVEVYRFTYEFCDSNVIAKRNYPDLMNLDIRPDGSSEFYSQYGQARANVSHINGTGLSQSEMMAQIQKMRSTKAGVGYRLLKDFDLLEREYHKDPMAFFLNQAHSEGKTIKIQDERGNEIKSRPEETPHIFIEKAKGDKR